MTEKTTIKEIAERARVSIGTVDRVIHNRGEVSPDTRKKIKKILEEVDYEPNVFGRNLALNKVFNIVVLLPKHLKSEYWHGPVLGVEASLKNLQSLGIRVRYEYYDQNNVKSFQQSCIAILRLKPDGILMAPVLHDESIDFLRRCHDVNIPVVLIDSDLPHENVLTFIGQDAHKSGYLAAKLLSYGLEPSQQFMIVSITNASDNNFIIEQRLGGFRSFFSETGRGAPKEYSFSQEDVDLTQNLQNIIDTSQNIAGIFVPNSKSHLIVEALNETYSTRIVGYDLIENNKEFLKQGKIDFIIHQRPEEQGQQGLEQLYKHIVLKQPVPRFISMPLDIITKENCEI